MWITRHSKPSKLVLLRLNEKKSIIPKRIIIDFSALGAILENLISKDYSLYVIQTEDEKIIHSLRDGTYEERFDFLGKYFGRCLDFKVSFI